MPAKSYSSICLKSSQIKAKVKTQLLEIHTQAKSKPFTELDSSKESRCPWEYQIQDPWQKTFSSLPSPDITSNNETS